MGGLSMHIHFMVFVMQIFRAAATIHPFSIITSPALRIVRGAEAYPRCLWARLGYALTKSPVYGHIERQTFALLSPICLQCMLLDVGRKLEYHVLPHRGHAIFTQKGPRDGTHKVLAVRQQC